MKSIKNCGLCAAMALAIAVGGCNSFDKRADDSNEPRLIIPLDERDVSTTPVAPPPVSGGTLSVLSDDTLAVVADPERDRISVVDLRTLAVRSTIALQAGDEPGRSVEDAQKHIHVALRRGGAVLTLDPATGSVLSRRAVCKAPRGIAFEPLTNLLHVACAEGKLVSLPAAGGDAVRTLTLDPDLRDVLVRGSELWVTRFKSAEVLRISSAGTLNARVKLPADDGVLSRPQDLSHSTERVETSSTLNVTLQPGVAWRAVADSSGGALLVHQDSVNEEIPISPPSAFGSTYGGGDQGISCGGIVKNVVSAVTPEGAVTSTTFMGPPLPVDIAVSVDQKWVAVAHAGVMDFSAPRPFLVFPSDQGTATSAGAPFSARPTVSVMALTEVRKNNFCAFPQGNGVAAPATALAFTANGRLLIQTRDPAQLIVQREVPFGTSESVDLGGDSRADTGHDLFHRDAGGGIACASCHPEGAEDGHTWRFAGFGERRTQALHVGLRDTAPFHWNGDLPNVGALMDQVFVGRMGGVRESAPRVSALSEWLFSLRAPAPIRDASEEAVQRGQALFQSADVGCNQCHSGPKLTDNRSLAIDSVMTSKLQVPSLVAVGYRAPFMHNGCAATLADRFDPACGGKVHGNTANLSAQDKADLVAYLETL